MKVALDSLIHEYPKALQDYLGGGGEQALRRAYELGRSALAEGAGVLDIVAAHEAASIGVPASRALPVLTECLSSYEMVLRGFREANSRLKESLAQLSRMEEERARAMLDRAEAEAGRRFAFLAQASDLLAGSLGDESGLARVVELAVPYLADWCCIQVCSREGNLLQLEIATSDAAQTARAAQLKSRLESALGPPCLRIAEDSPKIYSIGDESWLEHFATVPELLEIVREIGIQAAIVVPLASPHARYGALILISTQPQRTYTAADLILAEDLARRCVPAIENARLYREVIQERDSAAKANRAKDEFLAVLSHELRNPLMPVVGWARVLGRHSGIRNDPVLSEGVQALERNAQTLIRLAEDCLDLARISERKIAMNRIAVDLNQIILSSVESVRETARSQHLRLSVQVSPEPLWVSGDPVRLQQVVMNVLVNATKYTGKGGIIRVRSSRRDGQAEAEVRDTGIGIEPGLLEQIFQPFHQGRGFSLTSESGLGLGLAIARQIVDLHEGRVWAESSGPGAGSVFRIRLPLTAGPAPDPASVTTAPAAISSSGLRVLLVEDSEDVLFLLKMELERLGYATLQAHDGEEALQVALRERPEVIISDVKMPRMDGYEMVRRMRATSELSKTPAVALTGFGQKKDVEKALAAGFDACLAKPAEAEDLAACIRELAGRDPLNG